MAKGRRRMVHVWISVPARLHLPLLLPLLRLLLRVYLCMRLWVAVCMRLWVRHACVKWLIAGPQAVLLPRMQVLGLMV